jgi:4-hydroxy-tetrahydrodipicolinate synthase
MSSQIAGIFTPTMIPLDDAGEINEAELRRYIDWLLERGVHGLYPNGSTGEFPRFTAEERRRNIQIVCDQVAGRVPVLAGAAEANVRETLKACETYAEYGARAVAIVSPYYYRLSPGAVFAYYQEIARNSPIDVTLYHIPMFASPIDVPTVQRLAEFPRIIGIKDSSGDIAQLLRMMAAVESSRPEFVFLCGWEAAVVPMLAMGCQGATLAMSGIVPEITRKLFDLTMCGRLREARTLQFKFTELFDQVISDVPFPEGVRAAVETRGFKMGASRQPLDETQRIDAKKFNRGIERLLKSS